MRQAISVLAAVSVLVFMFGSGRVDVAKAEKETKKIELRGNRRERRRRR